MGAARRAAVQGLNRIAHRRRTQREKVDRDPLGELLRIGRRLQHLDELQVLRGDPDLVDQRLTDRVVVVDERAEDFGQVLLRLRPAGLRLSKYHLRHFVGMVGGVFVDLDIGLREPAQRILVGRRNGPLAPSTQQVWFS